MKISLEGACNARDLGGIVTKYGTIKLHRLVRCGELSRLTEKDVQILQCLPLTRVIDLRTAPEMSNCPDVVIDSVVYENISVLRATTFGITYEKSSGAEIAEMLQAGFQRMRNRGETYTSHMELLYRKFVQDSHSRDAYGQFLKMLANEPLEGATLWHCSAGKDRVGTCTALLLHCLGATTQQIFDDYLLTNVQSRESVASILNKVKGFVPQESIPIMEKMLLVDESYLQCFFQQIVQDFGTTENFLTECGVTAQDVLALRKNYLQ